MPTAEVLAHGKWSVSGYRRGTNYFQGLHQRRRLRGHVRRRGQGPAGSLRIVPRRHAHRPRPAADLPAATRRVGGFLDRVSARQPGLDRRQRRRPATSARRSICGRSSTRSRRRWRFAAIVKLPTGDKDVGVSTGKTDVAFDFIVSKETTARLELSGYAGYDVRGQPDDFDTPSGAFRWGGGVGLPVARSALRRGRDQRHGARATTALTPRRLGTTARRPDGSRRSALVDDEEPDAGARSASPGSTGAASSSAAAST